MKIPNQLSGFDQPKILSAVTGSPKPLATGYWEVDSKTGELILSPEIFLILNIDQGQIPSWNLLIDSVIDTDRSKFSQELREYLDKPGFFQLETFIQIPDHPIKPLLIEGTVVKIGTTDTPKICGFIKEYELDEASGLDLKKMEIIFDSLPDLVWVLDRSLQLTFANKAFLKEFEELTGIELQLSQPLIDKEFASQEILNFWSKAYEKAFQGIHFSEIIEFKKEGQTFYLETAFIPIQDQDECRYIACFAKDISLQKQKYQENNELIEKLNLSQQIGKIGYWEFDIETEKIFWSNQVFSIWDIPVNSIHPNFDYFISTFYPEDLPGFLVDHHAALSGLRPLDSVHRIKTAAGHTKYLREKGNITNTNGKKRFTGTVQDITEERKTRLLLEAKTNLISTTSKIVQLLLESNNWNDEVDYTLKLIGEATQSDRAYLFRITKDENDCLFASQTNEWTNGKVSPELQNPNLQYIPLEDHPDFKAKLFERKPFSVLTRNLSHETRPILEEQGILAMMNLPIFIENEFFGYIGLDDCHQERIWSDDEMSFLHSVTINLAFAIEKQRNLDNKLEALNSRNVLLESIKDLFYGLDQNYRVTYWNHVLEKRTGIRRDEILGKNIWEFVTTANEDFRKAYEEVLTKQQPVSFETYDVWMKSWLEVDMYPSEGGLSAIIRDVSEKKENERKIKEFIERFTLISQASNDAIWDWNLLTEERYWGEGFNTLFEEEISGIRYSHDLWLERIHPEDRELVQNTLSQVIEDPKESFFQVEYRLMRKEKGFFYLIDRGIIKRDEHGKAIRMVGAIQNISSRKAYEESMKILNKELLESNRELETINKELEQFAFVASHDLQEPIRMISSFLGLIEKKYSPLLDETGKKYIHFAIDGARRMRTVILDLLEFSRAGNISEEKKWVKTNSLVEEVLKFLAKDIQDKQATIHVGNLPDICCHANAMIQVFQNLISNGLKYQLPDHKPEIWIEGQKEPGEWKFSIRDNGIGIEEIYLEKIFVIFQRLHQKDQYSGSGIGLSICKKIVEYHQGKIWVESTPGKGSTFYFTIKE